MIDKTLVGWSNALKKIGNPDIASNFETDANRDFELVKQLKLQTYDSYQIPVSEFLRNYSYYEKNFIYEKYYLLLIPLTEELQKYSLVGFPTMREAKDFVVEKTKYKVEHYLLRISEYEINIYGGSIMSNDNIVVTEMGRGNQNLVAYGNTNVISARLTPTTISVKYTTNDLSERNLLWNAMSAILRYDETQYKVHTIRGFIFLKGYFEFAYTMHRDDPHLRLVFFDVKLSQGFYDIPSDCS
jgi:hypothetical protein